MTADVVRQNRVLTDLKLGAPTPQLADAFDVAQRAWARAFEACANRMGLAGPKAAADQVRQGNSTARMHCCHGLAEEMAASLRSSYQSIQAVYAPYCDACPQSFCLDEAVQTAPLVHLLVWAHHKPPAIGSRAAALGNALASVCQDVIGVQELPSLLHVQVIEDADLEGLFGAGRRERWPIRLESYLLGMNEPIEEV